MSSSNWRWYSTLTPTYYAVRNFANTDYRYLYTSDNASSGSGQPATTNVRSGTVYGPTNEFTGTCAVPAASSVAFGVAVDNTTGTAVLTQDAVRTAMGLAAANLDTQLAAIPTTVAPTAAQVRSEMDANSTKLANLDATVSSRLATSGYTAPPSASSIASAVWANATRTLTTAIDNSATIAAAVWSFATGRTITGGTVDTLTNAPTVPTPAQIASQVRTELTTELGRIDAAVSTRLAPSGTLARVTLTDTATTLTNAPSVPTPAQIAAEVWTTTERTITGGTLDSASVDAGEIADAVREELQPELSRVANTATTQEVAEIVEGALQQP